MSRHKRLPHETKVEHALRLYWDLAEQYQKPGETRNTAHKRLVRNMLITAIFGFCVGSFVPTVHWTLMILAGLGWILFVITGGITVFLANDLGKRNGITLS